MRMLVEIDIPLEPFNTYVRDGTAGEKIGLILDDLKPEATYFTDLGGSRGAVIIVDVPEASAVPSIAEPWFLTFNADVRFRIVMGPEDLENADLEGISTKWG